MKKFATLLFLAITLVAAVNAPCADYDVAPLCFQRDGMKIDGELLLPKVAAPLPVVLCAHGFGGSRFNVRDYAQVLAENGVAAYIFDFIGGGRNSRSDGKTTEMSVLTEADDLVAILNGIKNDERFDKDLVFLFGESQGGFVASYVACKNPNDVAALVALYPAYVVHDDAKKRTPDPTAIPETTTLMGMTLGAVYNRDALSFDIYDLMKDYKNKTLLIHGDQDWLVPYSYSERAAKTFPNAKLVKIEGANHGFRGREKEFAARTTLDFIQEAVRSKTTGSEQK
ncbi:MAG: alpha/beta fold hydrolase [Thermoguttaceae bacterium]|nr:alpha/beta fold hydrolase [Thermoguttaceae bacterium]